MAKLVRPEMCIPEMKRRQRTEKNPTFRAGIQIAINILEELPAEHVEDGIACETCLYYHADTRRCGHLNGLQGRVYPNYYCSYATHERGDEEPEHERFEMFEEEEDGDET